MNTALLFDFIIICLIIEATPGPNMGYLTILSMNKGRRAGFMTVAGITAGLLISGIAAAFGMATILSNSPALYHLLKLLGAAYLFWLAWNSWRDDSKAAVAKSTVANTDLRYFRHGFIINILNPKAIVFYISVLPGFVDPAYPLLQQTLLLTLASVALAAAAHAMIVLLASSLRPKSENAHKRRVIRKIMALMLAGVAVWFIL